jgi:hypothetical protein
MSRKCPREWSCTLYDRVDIRSSAVYGQMACQSGRIDPLSYTRILEEVDWEEFGLLHQAQRSMSRADPDARRIEGVADLPKHRPQSTGTY